MSPVTGLTGVWKFSNHYVTSDRFNWSLEVSCCYMFRGYEKLYMLLTVCVGGGVDVECHSAWGGVWGLCGEQYRWQSIVRDSKTDCELFRVTQSVARTSSVHFTVSVGRNQDNSPLDVPLLKTVTGIWTTAAGRITTAEQIQQFVYLTLCLVAGLLCNWQLAAHLRISIFWTIVNTHFSGRS